MRDHAVFAHRSARPVPLPIEFLEQRLCLTTYNVTNTNDDNLPGSLRRAINDANAHDGLDRIEFHIGSGFGFVTIAPTTPLPNITSPVTLDGTTETGYAGNPLVEIAGPGAGDGFNIVAAGCTIKGLSITGWSEGIRMPSNSNTVQFCWIGVRPSGAASGNFDGILISGANNLIGGPLGEGNVISANLYGVQIVGSEFVPAAGRENLLLGNLIGADPGGVSAVPNTVDGVFIRDGSDNRIGDGSSSGLNIISGNTRNGITISGNFASGNFVNGNFLGLGAGGAVVPNGAVGVSIGGAAHNNVVGPPDGATNYANLVAFNTGGGIYIAGAGTQNNIVRYNAVGTHPLGGAALPNGGFGIGVANDASNNTVSNNLVSGNSGPGIKLYNDLGFGGPVSNTFISNKIGIKGTATAALPNTGAGVRIENGFNNRIGLPFAGNTIAGNTGPGVEVLAGTGNRVTNNRIGTVATPAPFGNAGGGVIVSTTNTTIGGSENFAGNYFAANTGDAIQLTAGADNNSILGNIIGHTYDFGITAPNTGHGIHLINASNNTIGGTNIASANFIVASGLDGIRIEGASSANNVITGNGIGMDEAGDVNANTGDGIRIIDAADTRIGGTSAGAFNAIAANLGNGIHLAGLTRRTAIVGNRLGASYDGATPIASGPNGILVDASVADTTIGGTNTADRNVVGNYSNGIQTYGANTLIQGNHIGTNPAGNVAWHNTDGVILGGGATLGGTAPGAGNLISGNTTGVFVNQNLAIVRGNRIGTQADGVSPLPNTVDGVEITASNVAVGGITPGSQNVIAHNGGRGINVLSGTGNALFGNSFYNNANLAIDLNNDGVTLNDGLDSDSGPNNRQNFPVITLVESTLTQTTIKGTLNSTPSANFFIDIYASPTPDSTGYGEGKQYLGAFPASTDPSGNATFAGSFPLNIPAGWVITATAAGTFGDTSEFSQTFIVPDNIPPTATGGDFNVTLGPEHRAIIKFSENVAPLDPSDFTLRNLTTAADFPIDRVTWDPSTFTATAFFGRTLPDGNYRLRALSANINDPAGNHLDANGDGAAGDDFDFPFYVLGGDANRDRTVNFADLVTLAQHYNEPANPATDWFLADFTYDHIVNFNDLVVLAQNYNVTLPAPAAPVPSTLRLALAPSRTILSSTPQTFSSKKIIPQLPPPPVTKRLPLKRPARK